MNFNQIILAGNITRDIKLGYTPNQVAVADFGIAVNKKYKDKKRVCFVDLQAFGKTAEIVDKYFKKGDPIFITGELKFDTWTAKDGSKKSKHSVIVESFQFLGSSNTGQSGGNQGVVDNRPVNDEEIPF